MRSFRLVLPTVVLLFLVRGAYPGEDKRGLDDKGFITTWLLLAPIPLGEAERGAAALNKEQVKGEANLRPRPGDKVKVGGKELVWKKYRAKEYYFDFNDFLGKKTEDCVGYAVCYIHSDRELKGVLLQTGSDDQAMVYLNGKEVLRQDEDRELDKDDDTAEVTLRKGENVLVFKVINEKEDWSGCARFRGRDGRVITDLKVATAPK
jgi:hypothetical protein